MLTGEYSHTIDDKGRFNFPAKFREELGESFFVTKGFDSNGCLFVYSKTEWNILADKILSLPFSTILYYIFPLFAILNFYAHNFILFI